MLTPKEIKLSYRRHPDILLMWQDGGLVIIDTRSGRRFSASAQAFLLLDHINGVDNIAELEKRTGIEAARLPRMLSGLSRVGLLITSNDNEEALVVPSLNPLERAVHYQAGGRRTAKYCRRGEPPSARQDQRQSVTRIPLARSGGTGKGEGLKGILASRRSIREYSEGSLRLNTLAAFFENACSVRHSIGPQTQQTTHRASPSAGARHSLEIYALVRDVDELARGAYYYDPFDHELINLAPWSDTLEAVLEQFVCGPARLKQPPQISFYLTAVFGRVAWKYHTGALAIIYRDTGCLMQTMYLVATDLQLAPCAIAAIDPDLSPSFLASRRDAMIHVGSFALGLASNV